MVNAANLRHYYLLSCHSFSELCLNSGMCRVFPADLILRWAEAVVFVTANMRGRSGGYFGNVSRELMQRENLKGLDLCEAAAESVHRRQKVSFVDGLNVQLVYRLTVGCICFQVLFRFFILIELKCFIVRCTFTELPGFMLL